MGVLLEEVARARDVTVEEVEAGLKDGTWKACACCELPERAEALREPYDNDHDGLVCAKCADEMWEAFMEKSEAATYSDPEDNS